MARIRPPPLISAEMVNPTGEIFYNGFSYAFEVFDAHPSYADLITWCTDRFGEEGDPETAPWHVEMQSMRKVCIWFREASQALEFKLRWT